MKNKILLLIVTITLVNTWFALTRLSNAQNPNPERNLCNNQPSITVDTIKTLVLDNKTSSTLNLQHSLSQDKLPNVLPSQDFKSITLESVNPIDDKNPIITITTKLNKNLYCKWYRDQNNNKLVMTFETDENNANNNSYKIFFKKTEKILKVESSS